MNNSMIEFHNGAKFARDSILDLILELKDNVGQRFASWASEVAQAQLEDMHKHIVSVYGDRGSIFTDGYLDYYFARLDVQDQTFAKGVEFGKQQISGFIHVAQGEIGHALKHSIEYQSLEWLCSAIDGAIAVDLLNKKMFDFYKNRLLNECGGYGRFRFNAIEYMCSFPEIDPVEMAVALKMDGHRIVFDDSAISYAENVKKEKTVERAFAEAMKEGSVDGLIASAAQRSCAAQGERIKDEGERECVRE